MLRFPPKQPAPLLRSALRFDLVTQLQVLERSGGRLELVGFAVRPRRGDDALPQGDGQRDRSETEIPSHDSSSGLQSFDSCRVMS